MKNIQIINKLVARDLNYDEKEVQKVNDFFWKETRRKLSSLESASVTIKHIGTVTTSKRKIDHYIKMTIGKIRNTRKSNRLKESTKAILLDVYYDRLKKALVQRNILSTRYNAAYVQRANRIHKVDPNDVPECGQDLGGSGESSENAVGELTGGGASGDNQPQDNLCDVSV